MVSIVWLNFPSTRDRFQSKVRAVHNRRQCQGVETRVAQGGGANSKKESIDVQDSRVPGQGDLRKFGVAVPRGILAPTPDEAERARDELGTKVTVVKAQIHAGGRGKGGGVKLAKSPRGGQELAAQILGMMLKTHQTGPEGQKVRKVYIEEGLDIARELYLGMTLDRDTSRVTLMASPRAAWRSRRSPAKHPEKIFKEAIDPAVGFADFQGRELAFALGLPGPTVGKFVAFCRASTRRTWRPTPAWSEINPLVVTAGAATWWRSTPS